jgi:hypothetical protein
MVRNCHSFKQAWHCCSVRNQQNRLDEADIDQVPIDFFGKSEIEVVLWHVASAHRAGRLGSVPSVQDYTKLRSVAFRGVRPSVALISPFGRPAPRK